MISNSREIEASLVIWSETPQAVAARIASLTSIANYRLLPRASQLIHDVYLDTHDRALRLRRLALRAREIGGTCWITFKGPVQPTGWAGGVERFEIEVPWSEQAQAMVVEELEARGVNLLKPEGKFDDVHPLDVLADLGMEVVQDRQTSRQLRDIVAVEQAGLVIAELAIDSVVFHFKDRNVRYHEIEVEAKAEGGVTAVEVVIENLITMIGSALRPWDYGKLATGKAIEELLKIGALQGLLDMEDSLKPAAFDKIIKYFEVK